MKKKIVIGIIVLIGLISTIITYKYSDKHTEVIHNDLVGVYIGGEKSNRIPSATEGYILEKYACNDDTILEWNYKTWSVVLKNFKKGTACEYYFVKGHLITVYNEEDRGSEQEKVKIDEDIIGVAMGKKVKDLPIPNKKGYTFQGWYDEYGNPLGEETLLDNVNKVIARFTINTYTLKIDPNEGTYDNSTGIKEINLKYNEKYQIQEITRMGYDFSGWDIEGDDFEISGNILTIGANNVTLKAKWTTHKYTLSIDKGCNSEIQIHKLEYRETMTIENPVCEGYTFTGWNDTNSFSGTTYTQGSADKALIANWTANKYKWIVYHKKMNIGGNGYTLADAEEGQGDFGSTFKGTLKNYTGFTNPTQATKVIEVDKTPEESGEPTKNKLDYNYIRNKYNLTINPNGGEYNGSTNSYVVRDLYYDETYSVDIPTLACHVFDGWEITGGTITDRVFKIQGAATLRANWIKSDYVITYNVNGGNSLSTVSENVACGDTLGQLPIPSRSGYTFVGWFTESEGGTQVTSATLPKSSMTLYAHWTTNTYTVSVSSTGLSLNKQSLSLNYSGSDTVTVTPNDGYVLQSVSCTNGYSSSSIAGGALASAAQTITITNNSYEGNGSCIFTGVQNNSYTGYTISPNGNWEAHYTAGVMDACYYRGCNSTGGSCAAVNNYIVVNPPYSNGSGTKCNGGTAGVNQYYPCKLSTLNNINPNQYCNSSIGTTSPVAGGGLTSSDDELYTITILNHNTISGTISPKIAKDGSVNASIAPNTGYYLSSVSCTNGYTTNAKTGTTITDSQIITISNNGSTEGSTCTMTGSGITYPITLDQQGGTNGSISVSAVFGEAMPSATAPTRDGYIFGGYYSSTGGDGTQYYDASMNSVRSWNKTTNTTLYAKWTANTYTVTFDFDGGNSGSQSTTVAYGQAMPSGLTKPVKTGYVFDGYYSSDNVQYYDSSMISSRHYNINGDTTLYAHWTGVSMKVSLDKQGGSGGSDALTATYGAALPSGLTAPVKTGYDFAGYYERAGQSGTQYYDENMQSVGTWLNASTGTSVSIYAGWNPKTYTITFEQNNGSGGSNSVTATYGEEMPFAIAPSKENYEFAGYYTNVQDENTKYYDAQMNSVKNWNIASNTTLYAKWTYIYPDYTITYDTNSSDGVVDPMFQVVSSGGPIGTLPTPTRPGYSFVGWFTDPNNGSQITSNYTLTNDMTVYAHWTTKSYNLRIVLFYLTAPDATVNYAAPDGITHKSRVSTIAFGGSTTITVTPESGRVLSGMTCSGNYGINASVGYNSYGSQVITISNGNTDADGYCEVHADTMYSPNSHNFWKKSNIFAPGEAPDVVYPYFSNITNYGTATTNGQTAFVETNFINGSPDVHSVCLNSGGSYLCIPKNFWSYEPGSFSSQSERGKAVANELKRQIKDAGLGTPTCTSSGQYARCSLSSGAYFDVYNHENDNVPSGTRGLSRAVVTSADYCEINGSGYARCSRAFPCAGCS